MVHFHGDSSEDEEEEYASILSISFEDMVAQANAQSDHYALEEDSEDEWDTYEGSYEDHVTEEHKEKESGVQSFGAIAALGLAAHVCAEHRSAWQDGCVSQPGGDTRLAGAQPKPQQQAPSSNDSGAGGSKAGRAGEAELAE